MSKVLDKSKQSDSCNRVAQHLEGQIVFTSVDRLIPKSNVLDKTLPRKEGGWLKLGNVYRQKQCGVRRT